MSTITPNRHTPRRNDNSAPQIEPPPSTVNAQPITPDDRSKKTHLLAINAILTAQQSRQVKKLESVSELILSQEPLAIIPTIIELATSMTAHHEKIIQRYAAVAKFSTKDDDGTLYVPKSARINIPITCSDSIKENEKAITLIAEGARNCTAARVALADTMRKMAQLELETAIHIRTVDFIRITFSICEDLVFHTLKNEQVGTTTRSIEAFAFLCFQSFGKAKLSDNYYLSLLSVTPKDVYDGMLAIAAPNHDPNTDDLMTPSVTGPEGLAIQRVSDTLARFFIAITADLKIHQSAERKIKEDNSKILARRKAKEIAAATKATAESLDKETAMNYTTMLTVIQNESEKAAKKASKTYLQSALRKKSSGSRRQSTTSSEPTTAGGKRSKAATGTNKKPQTNKQVSFHDSTKAPKKNHPKPKSKDKPKTPNVTTKTSNNNQTGKNKRQQNGSRNRSATAQNNRVGKRKGPSNENGRKKKARQQK
jgi:hypothetical protein